MNTEQQEEKVFYHYILVRKDLPIPVQMVNVAHAAGESIIDAPIPPTTRAIVLHVENEEQLLLFSNLLKQKEGLHHVLIREPDAPYNGEAMALGLAPSQRRNFLRRLFYHLELVK